MVLKKRRRSKKPPRSATCTAEEKLIKFQADAQAARRQAEGEDVNAYKCREADCVLINGSRSWHVGRPPGAKP